MHSTAERFRKIAAVCTETSKAFGGLIEIKAVPYPSPSSHSAWAFIPEGFDVHGFLIKLRALDSEPADKIAHTLYEAMTAAGVKVDPLPAPEPVT